MKEGRVERRNKGRKKGRKEEEKKEIKTQPNKNPQMPKINQNKYNHMIFDKDKKQFHGKRIIFLQ